MPPINEPNGIPQSYDEHIRLHYDLIALGFQADITRVATLLGARISPVEFMPFPKALCFRTVDRPPVSTEHRIIRMTPRKLRGTP